jgi:cell division protein FtsW (lipid II flippase)
MRDKATVWQVKIFVLSFIVHVLCEVGITAELLTAAFYRQKIEDDSSKDPEDNFKFANMQVVLLAVGVVYFFLGTTLEYAKHSDKILVFIVLAYGLFKTGVGIYFIVKGFKDTFGNRRDIEILELHDTTTFLLVAPRFAIFTIFIISLAKWFTRQ